MWGRVNRLFKQAEQQIPKDIQELGLVIGCDVRHNRRPRYGIGVNYFGYSGVRIISGEFPTRTYNQAVRLAAKIQQKFPGTKENPTEIIDSVEMKRKRGG